MCGICGILQPDGDRAAREERVERMTDALVHRGPDDSGAWSDDRISLGFRRLAVIDLETGNQPIRLEDDRAVIVLNGEIYNFRELRRELAGRQTFRTRGDVEVVLRLYAEEGIDCLRRLNGMFAAAIWDRAARTLHLARDRFGIKPLFVCEKGDQVAFGSELRTLLAGGFPTDRALDPLELRHFLYQKYTSPSGSILGGVEAVPPGTVLSIGPRGRTLRRFWEPPEPTVPAPADLRQELEERLQIAARRQLVADVPVGVFLSGGLDSSTLAALVRRVEGGPVRTFSVGFEGPDAVNELPAAREVARALGTEHHELTMDPDAVAWDLADILGDLDGPLGDATCIPTWYMSRLARGGVTVALSGEGADEIFGGYERQRYDVWIDSIGRWGRAVAPLAMRLAGRRPSARLSRRLKMPNGLERWLDWSKIFTAEEVDALAAVDLPGEREVLALHEDFATRWRDRAGRDPLNARLEGDRELFLPGDLLPKVDRMSMAHSLEVRVPYLDNELVDWVLPLPGRLKADRRQGKLLLRAVAASMLPEAARRPKQGFDVPVSAWLRGPLREPMTDLLSEETVRRRGLFRPETVSRMVREHLDGETDHGEPLWLLMALEGWQQRALGARATRP
jgi:asparagine synthase (glutamine-hydrolysing)